MAKKNDNPGASTQTVVIDRIEEDRAVMLLSESDETQFKLPLSLLPAEAKAGDWLQLTLTIDHDNTAAARNRVAALQAELTQANPQEMNIQL